MRTTGGEERWLYQLVACFFVLVLGYLCIVLSCGALLHRNVPIDSDSLPDVDEVWGCVETCGVACMSQNAFDHGAGGPLAFGAGDVDDAEVGKRAIKV